MRALLLLLILLSATACRRPEPVSLPPRARLVVHFLDLDAELGLPATPPPGGWAYLDAGAWRTLEIQWGPGGDRGSALVPRTAPTWVLLRDPTGEIHRIVMREDPEPSLRTDRLEEEEREWLATLGLLWLLQWIRH